LWIRGGVLSHIIKTRDKAVVALQQKADGFKGQAEAFKGQSDALGKQDDALKVTQNLHDSKSAEDSVRVQKDREALAAVGPDAKDQTIAQMRGLIADQAELLSDKDLQISDRDARLDLAEKRFSAEHSRAEAEHNRAEALQGALLQSQAAETAAKHLAATRWGAGISFGTDSSRGAWVERDFGPLRAGVDVIRRQLNGGSQWEANARVGIHF
jgi:hypothetical protein